MVYNESMTDEQEYPQPPEHIRVLKNGAGYNTITKRIEHAPGTYAEAPYNITSENAAQMAAIGRENAKRAIRDAIVEQARARGVNVLMPADALGHAAGLLFGEVLDGSGTLRDRNRVLWDVGKYSDLVESHENSGQQQVNVQVNVTADILRDILSTTGGQVIDIDP